MSEVGAGSEKKVWWKCPKGHSYEMFVYHRTGKQACGCPYCSNKKCLPGYNDLQTLEPELVSKYWDFAKNTLKPNEVMRTSSKIAFWKCQDCGYEWESKIVARTADKTRYRICPVCWKKKLKRGPESSFKAVYCIELDKTYESLAEASRKTHANRSSIRDNINGKLGRVKGYPYKNRYLKCLIVENI